MTRKTAVDFMKEYRIRYSVESIQELMCEGWLTDEEAGEKLYDHGHASVWCANQAQVRGYNNARQRAQHIYAAEVIAADILQIAA